MSILITNCRIFDGESPKLIEGMSVLIEGNKISRIEPDLPAPDGATTLDARGKTLIPDSSTSTGIPCSVSGRSARS